MDRVYVGYGVSTAPVSIEYVPTTQEEERTFEQPVNDRVEIDLRGVISHDKGE